MNLLYILSEDATDTDFYDLLVRKLLPNQEFSLVPLLVTNKKGHKNVTQGIRRLLSIVKRTHQSANQPNAFVLVAVDNDRRKIHPTHHILPQPPSSDAGKDCRFCELEQAKAEIWGNDASQFPAQYAFAVPVQMIESWLLQMVNPSHNELNLPSFDEQKALIAQQYYKSANPPPQLKDLWQWFKDEQKIVAKEEGILYAIDALNPETLCQQSPSFKQFYQQIQQWNSL
jgi:hypothetical protein